MTRIAIVGGGCAAALVLANLARSGAVVDVTVVEPAAELGRGGAYSTDDPQHLLNVRAGGLGAFDDDVEDFARWLLHRGRDPKAAQFQPRQRYGDYLGELAADAVERLRARGGSFEHRRTRAVGIRAPRRLQLLLDDGSAVDADQVVVAIGPPPTQLPEPIRSAVGARGIDDPWQAAASAGEPGGTTLLVGTGLTAIDVALTTCTADPAATVVACSRSGLVPRAHLVEAGRPGDVDLTAFDAVDPSADDYAAAFEVTVERARAQGLDWRDVVDALRPRTQPLWRALPAAQKQRFFERYGRSWEVVRHRMAPAIAERVAQLEHEGRLRFVAGGVESAVDRGDAVRIALGGHAGAASDVVDAHRIVNCTGFGTSIVHHPDPFVRSLLRQRLAVPDDLRAGVRADDDGRLVPADERLLGGDAGSNGVYVIGALRRGELLETTAVPELRTQAARVARSIAIASVAERAAAAREHERVQT